MKPDKDILDTVVGETTIRDMSAISFLQWLAKKIDSVKAFSAATQEITMALSNPPLSNKMPDEEKVKYWRKLEQLGVPLP